MPVSSFGKFLMLLLAAIAVTSAPARAQDTLPDGRIPLCPALGNNQLYKDKANEDYAMMIAGKDGWLFRSRFDLKYRFVLTERTLDSFRRLADNFRANGTELVIMMMPTRGLTEHDKLVAPQAGDYDFRAAKASYLKMLDEIRGTGITVVDMSGVDSVSGYFLKRDNHWTYKGARYTADKTAEAIKALPVYASLKKQDYETRETGEIREATHRYAEFVNRICGTDIRREVLDKIFETTQTGDHSSADALFGDQPLPEIALLGTSNSTTPGPSFANFEGFLKEDLHADILNDAVSGGSLQGSISNYILNGRYKQTHPKIIVWEMSAHYGFNNQDFLREIVPSVRGDCSGDNLIASSSAPVDGSLAPVVMDDLADKGATSHKYYVSLKLDDTNVRKMKIIFTHADGRTNTVKLDRSKRNFPVNNGQFFAELSDVMEAPLQKVSLDFKDPATGKAEAHLCRAPGTAAMHAGQALHIRPLETADDADDDSKSGGESLIRKWLGNFAWLSDYSVTAGAGKMPLKKPELPDLRPYNAAAAIMKIPNLQDGEVEITDMEGAAPLRKYAFDKRLVEFQNIQGRVEPEAVHIYSGVYDIDSLMKATAGSNAIVEKGNGYLVRLPIALYPDAALVLKNLKKPLLFSQQRGAFIASAGDLFIINSKIYGWDEERDAPALLNDKLNNFRPFITTWDGSESYFVNSEFKNLGYSLSKSYGISFSTNDVIQEEFEEEHGSLPPPGGWILNCSFEGLYFGFYSYEARDVALLHNTYKDNVIYGIDPHDRSQNLVIAYNDISGSRKKHGIIVSRDVKNSYIIYNTLKNNTGSGIMLDRHSTNNVVAYNTSEFNKGDGITVYESPDNILYGNILESNFGNGVRIRNSWNIDVRGGRVALNKNYAFQVYEDPLTNTGRDFDMDPVTTRAGASFADVALESNTGVLKTGGFESVLFEGLDLAKDLQGKAPFAGDVSATLGPVQKYVNDGQTTIELRRKTSPKTELVSR